MRAAEGHLLHAPLGTMHSCAHMLGQRLRQQHWPGTKSTLSEWAMRAELGLAQAPPQGGCAPCGAAYHAARGRLQVLASWACSTRLQGLWAL